MPRDFMTKVDTRSQIVNMSPPLQSGLGMSFRLTLDISGRTPTVKEGAARHATNHHFSKPRLHRSHPAAIPSTPTSIIAHDEGSGTCEPVCVSSTPDDDVNETPLTSEMPSAAVWLKSHVSPRPQES